MNAQILKKIQYTRKLNGSDKANSTVADVTLWPRLRMAPLTIHAPNSPGKPIMLSLSNKGPCRLKLNLQASTELAIPAAIIAAVKANLFRPDPDEFFDRFSRCISY